MSIDVDARVSRLMDQLVNPELSSADAQRIEGKIVMLRAQA